MLTRGLHHHHHHTGEDELLRPPLLERTGGLAALTGELMHGTPVAESVSRASGGPR